MELKITNNMKHLDGAAKIDSGMDNAAKQKIAKAAKDFESLLTSMMLKSMNSTEGGMFGEESLGGDYFETIFNQQIATYMGKSKDMGIASMLYKKITGEDLPELNLKTDLSIPPIEPGKSSINRMNRFDDIIKEASETYNIDPALVKSVILAESAGNERAYSKANAKGLMQLIDTTASAMGVRNVWDPKENVFGGTKYLADLLRQYNGDVKLALAGYNSGPGNVQKYNGIPPFEETRNYVTRVMGYYNHLKSIV